MLASCFGGDGPVVRDLQEMNALFRRLKKDAVVITIHSIPLNRLKGLVFTDASLANNKEDQRTQVCYLACMADQSILEGKEAKVSVLAYKSHKMTRSASNVLYTESFGMSDGLAFMEWMGTWFGLAKDLHYKIQERDTYPQPRYPAHLHHVDGRFKTAGIPRRVVCLSSSFSTSFSSEMVCYILDISWLGVSRFISFVHEGQLLSVFYILYTL